LFGIYRQLSIL